MMNGLTLPNFPCRAKFIHFVLYLLCFVIVSGSFLGYISSLAVHPLKFAAPLFEPFPAKASLMAEAVSVDPILRTIVMDWYLDFETLDCRVMNTLVTDILLDPSLLDTRSPSWAAQAPYPPLFRLNYTHVCLGLTQTPFPSFRTVTKLRGFSDNVPILQESGQSTLQNYPFDKYVATFSFSTRDVDTGNIRALNITHAFGVAVNFELSLRMSFVKVVENIYLHASWLQVAFLVERSKATKIFVIMVVITNWLIAGTFLIMCAAALVYHPHQIYAEMFVVPVGALFAITSVRANLPGAPAGFGTTLDMYSTLPILVIMSSCSFLMILIILHRRVCDLTAASHKKDYFHPTQDAEQGERHSLTMAVREPSLHFTASTILASSEIQNHEAEVQRRPASVWDEMDKELPK